MHNTVNKRYHRELGVLLILILVTFISCSNEEAGLAAYDGGIISKAEFLTRYQHYLSVTGIEDNLPDRKKLLRSAIHEELILQDWHSKGLDSTPNAQVVLKRQAEQAILDSWWQKQSHAEGEPSPGEIARMLVYEKSYYHLMESVYPTLAAAEKAYADWINGQSINADDLGFITLEDIHPRLVKRVNSLEPGEVSIPIRMGGGYRLIKLVEKKVPPFIQPQDFAAARHRLIKEWHVTRSDSMVDAYTKALAHKLDIQFNAAGSAKLLDIIQNTPKEKLQNSLGESVDASLPICSSIDGNWTIRMIASHLVDTKNSHLEAVIDIFDVQNLVSGILVRRSLLTEATQAGIHKNPATMDAIRIRQDLWRIKSWQQQFADTVTIDELYLAEIEDANPQILAGTIYRNIELLVFADTKTAFESSEKLNSGFSVDKIAGKIKPPSIFPSDGRLGWVSVHDLGQAAGLVFEESLNTWTQPWNYNGESFLFRSLAEKTEEVNENERRRNIVQHVRSIGAPVHLEKALSMMEQTYNVKIYEERIKAIPYIQASGLINES